VLGQIRDVVAPAAQDALLAVDERDGAAAGPRVRESRVHRNRALFAAQRRDVQADVALGALDDRQPDRPAPEGQFREVARAFLPIFRTKNPFWRAGSAMPRTIREIGIPAR